MRAVLRHSLDPIICENMNRLLYQSSTVFFMFGQKFEKKYNNELVKGAVSKETRFEYAWCLIRSKYTEDIKKGIVLLEGQFIITFRMIRLRRD